MATVQGVCKNCGSLMMFDDKEKDCECVFCNCIFPSSEALALYENSDGVEFPNEKYEKSADSKHYHNTKVYSDESLKKAIARDEVSKLQKNESKIKPSDFEVSPSDVKAPKKMVMAIIAAIAIFVIVVIVTAYPAYNNRVQLEKDIKDNIAIVIDGTSASLSINNDAGVPMYSISGQKSENFTLVVDKKLGQDDALLIYNNYSNLRNEMDGKSVKNIDVTIYCNGGIYHITGNDADSVEYIKD